MVFEDFGAAIQVAWPSRLGREKLLSEPRLSVSSYKRKIFTGLLVIGELTSTSNLQESRKSFHSLLLLFEVFLVVWVKSNWYVYGED